MKLLIDGDLMVFAICAAAEYSLEDGEAIPYNDVCSNIDAKIRFLSNRLESTDVEIYFTGKHNFRTAVTDAYKANRAAVWRPASLSFGKKYATAKYEAFCVDGLEADDLMVMRQAECLAAGIPSTICTIDKDLAQMDGNHYGWETQHRGEYFTVVNDYGKLVMEGGPATADKKAKPKKVKGSGEKFFHFQLLIGDATDGIIGCGKKVTQTYKTGAKAGEAYEKRSGIGQVEAFDLLDKVTNRNDAIKIVMQAYMTTFGEGWEDQLLIQGRCLYMTRKTDPEKGILLWHPFGEEEWLSWADACADHLPVEGEYTECLDT